jgi:large subunit ribosomal protein L22
MANENKTQVQKTAIARGTSVPISTKHAIAICRFLKGRKINESIELLEKVIRQEEAIPFRAEVPHKKGIPARYPVNASQFFIKLLKSLAANASQKNMNLEIVRIHGNANLASRGHKPGRIGRRKFKRTHVLLVAEEQLK